MNAEQELKARMRNIIKEYLKSDLNDKGMVAFRHEICDYIFPSIKDALPELAKEAGYKSPEEVADILKKYLEALKEAGYIKPVEYPHLSFPFSESPNFRDLSTGGKST